MQGLLQESYIPEVTQDMMKSNHCFLVFNNFVLKKSQYVCRHI